MLAAQKLRSTASRPSVSSATTQRGHFHRLQATTAKSRVVKTMSVEERKPRTRPTVANIRIQLIVGM